MDGTSFNAWTGGLAPKNGDAMEQRVRCRAMPVTCMAWCLVLVTQPLWASTGNDNCVDKLNNDGRKVLHAEPSKDRMCIRPGSGGAGSRIPAAPRTPSAKA